jgi:hypothetical protein
MEIVNSSAGTNGSIPTTTTTTTSSPSSTQLTLDPNILIDHLVNLIEITLGASLSDLQNNDSLLSKSKKSETIQRCQRFATESQPVLYVQKDLLSEKGGERENTGKEKITFLIREEEKNSN